ncbi:DUF1848 family protein [bacterium]|nr:DUF1848 family protein [bacterium]
MKIGITERGDAGINFSWYDKLPTVDGAVIITKKMSDEFIDKMLTAVKPVALHCTCTGWGGTYLEPNVPDYKTQLDYLKKLLSKGFDVNRVIVRIDPIIPTTEGIERVCNVLNYIRNNDIPVRRIRFSIYDEYPHARQRLAAIGKTPFYPDNKFTAPANMMKAVADALIQFTDFTFESCAEPAFVNMVKSDNFIEKGCVNADVIKTLGLEITTPMLENMQNRHGCHCLSCKTELLTERKRCPNGCLYCYWK